jgi:hypothetical protein
VVIVPRLALAFGVDVRYAIGASLVSVIATSSDAAAAYDSATYETEKIGKRIEALGPEIKRLGAKIKQR